MKILEADFVLTCNDLFDIIEKNGFKLEEEKKLEDAGMLLLRFRKK